jgi:hypothetical protein
MVVSMLDVHFVSPSPVPCRVEARPTEDIVGWAFAQLLHGLAVNLGNGHLAGAFEQQHTVLNNLNR